VKKIYKGQSALRLIVKTYTDLKGADRAAIRYVKPGKAQVRGEFSAVVDDEERGIIRHDFNEGELDESGWWVFWAYAEFAGGRCAAGEPVKVYVWEEGRL
jgi:hypothetical protein